MRLHPLLRYTATAAALLGAALTVATYRLTDAGPDDALPLLPEQHVAKTAPHGGLAADLERHVRFLAGIKPARLAAYPDALDEAAAYITNELQAARTRVEVYDRYIARNLYQDIIGNVGEAGPERIVVAAHYDSAGPTPGADDNASGTAVLIETARLLAASPPGVAVEFLAHTLGDPRRNAPVVFGSARRAASLSSRGIQVRAMIALDTVGYFSDAPHSQHLPVDGRPAADAHTGDFAALLGEAADAPLLDAIQRGFASAVELPMVRLDPAIRMQTAASADTRGYRLFGARAALITDTAFYRNPHYHLPTDRPETLDYARMAELTRGLVAAIHEIARRQGS